MPIEQVMANLRRREEDTRTTGDIHEADTAYLKACRRAAEQAAAHFRWTRIPCVDEGGAMRSPPKNPPGYHT